MIDDISRYLIAWAWLALMVISTFAVRDIFDGCASLFGVYTGIAAVLWVAATIKTRNLRK